MPVNTDPAQINPFTSTVPLVQLPPSAVDQETRPAQPLEGQFKGKGTGALALGDALLKGIMAGHQVKEQKKQAQAQATIAAADGATQAAWGQYQDALTKAGGKQDDPAAQAAYQAYTNVFNQSKQAKAQFVIPEKQGKGGQKTGDGKGKKDQKSGWANFKDFFEANPHIVPAIALATMQPKPPGAEPETQQNVQNLESQKLANQKNAQLQQNEKTYQDGFSTFAHLSPADIAALPPEVKKGYDQWQNARAAITPLKYTGTAKLYDLGGGKKAYLYPEEAAQYYPDAQPVDPREARPGQAGFSLEKYAQKLGKRVEDLTWDEIEAAKAEDKAATTVGSSTTSTSTTDIKGDRTTTTTRKPVAGGIDAPPRSAASPTGQGKQPITPPPVAPKTASGGIQPPPGGKQTWQTMQVTRQAVEKQQEGYQKAEKGYSGALAAADKAYAADVKNAKDDPALMDAAKLRKDRAYARAQLDLLDAKDSVAKEYDAKVKSIGGTPGSEQPKQYRYQTNPNDQGVVLGSDDGQNWVDTRTGQPYQQ